MWSLHLGKYTFGTMDHMKYNGVWEWEVGSYEIYNVVRDGEGGCGVARGTKVLPSKCLFWV